jgi:hypothetical protein
MISLIEKNIVFKNIYKNIQTLEKQAGGHGPSRVMTPCGCPCIFTSFFI